MIDKKVFHHFLGINPVENSTVPPKFSIIQANLERTTLFQHGCALGPQAILRASQFVSPQRFGSKIDLAKLGILTQPSPGSAFEAPTLRLGDALDLLQKEVEKSVADKLLPIILGGECTVSLAAVRALKKTVPDLNFLMLNSHAHLHATFEGSPLSHTCLQRRVLDEGIPTCLIGCRHMDPEEITFAESQDLAISSAEQFRKSDRTKELLKKLVGKKLYVGFSVTALDPSDCPGATYVEPYGLHPEEVREIFDFVIQNCDVRGFDFCDLVPEPNSARSEFLTASLVAHVIEGLAKKF